jgi:hypothetical protein
MVTVGRRPWQHPWNYRCVDSHKNGYTEPFTPTRGNSASWLQGVRSFSDEDGARHAVNQVRLIATGIDWEEGEDGPVEHEPQVLPRSVSSTLFEALSSETGLGLDQVRFFGTRRSSGGGSTARTGELHRRWREARFSVGVGPKLSVHERGFLSIAA